MLPVGTLLLTWRRLPLAWLVHPALFAVESTLVRGRRWRCDRARPGRARDIYRQLERTTCPRREKAVSRIVGRDTEKLTREGVTKAAVETVAENASDGVIAPLFLHDARRRPLALTYKAVNTMDSMVGYKTSNT